MKSNYPESYKWALTGVFAALHVIASVFPYNIAIGVEGQISIGLLTSPLIGILLGPIYGTVAVLAGSIVGISVMPSVAVLGIFTPIATSAAAFCAGIAVQGKGHLIAPIYAITLVLFIASPLVNIALIYLWAHIIAFIVSLPFVIPQVRKWASSEIAQSRTGLKPTAAIWLVLFISMMLDQAVGSTIGAFYFSNFLDPTTLAGFYLAAIIIYPLERIIASLIGTGIVISIKRALEGSEMSFPLINGNATNKEDAIPAEW